MADARRMGKSELFSHFAEKFEMKRAQAREFFDELNSLAESELKRANEFVLPGMCKLVVQNRKARQGRNPATGETIQIPAKTVVKARIAKQLKDSVLPGRNNRASARIHRDPPRFSRFLRVLSWLGAAAHSRPHYVQPSLDLCLSSIETWSGSPIASGSDPTVSVEWLWLTDPTPLCTHHP